MLGAYGSWFDILYAKYGHSHVTSLSGGRSLGSRSSSSWWKGVSLLGSIKDDLPNWFEVIFVKKVGTSLHTSFWEDTWIGNILLMTRFQRL